MRPHDEPEGRDGDPRPHRHARALPAMRPEPGPRGTNHRDGGLGRRAAADDPSAHRRGQSAGGRVHHLHRRLEHQRPCREAPADRGRARRRSAQQPGLSLDHRRGRRSHQHGRSGLLHLSRHHGRSKRHAQRRSGTRGAAGRADRGRPAARHGRSVRFRLEPRAHDGHRHGARRRGGGLHRGLPLRDEPVAAGQAEGPAALLPQQLVRHDLRRGARRGRRLVQAHRRRRLPHQRHRRAGELEHHQPGLRRSREVRGVEGVDGDAASLTSAEISFTSRPTRRRRRSRTSPSCAGRSTT